jgi:hypothetical protein
VACPWTRICRIGQVFSLQGCILIWISTTLLNMNDSLFTTPTCSNASNIRWWFNLIIVVDNYYDVDYFTIMIVFCNVLVSGCKY